ncbi:MAG: hypothetical protein ABR936_12640 [Bacteroidota bacterium]|jgi:glycosyltransferase involved in cell wall biosynthesis
MKKILIISDWGPPMLDGPSIILGNLLREFKPDELVLYKRKINEHLQIYNKKGNEVSAKMYSVFVPSPHSNKYAGFVRRIMRFIESAMIPITVLKGVWINIIERPTYIMVTSDPPHCHFLIAGYLISILSRKKLFLYLLDPLEEFGSSGFQKRLFKFFMPLIFHYASEVIVMNELLAEFYKQKYGVQCKILYHSIDNRNVVVAKEEKAVNNDIYTILFSGNISRFQIDSLLNLKDAIQLIPHKIRLLLFSPTNEIAIRESGFRGDHISIAHYDHDLLMNELKKADILFLPLSFKQSDSIIVKAAFPSKTMDYLAAQRPILIHAPEDCFIVKYAKERMFAEVVTENNIVPLAEAIELLLFNKEKQQELIENSYTTLLRHKSSQKYRELIDILEMN